MTFRLLAFALLCTASAIPGMAQVNGIISGRVEDSSGTPVEDAKVSLTNSETSAARSVSTDSNGNYRFLSVPLGQQEVKVEKSGFKTAVRKGVNLEVGQEAVVNLRLEVGELAQQIVVTEEAPVVNTTTANVSGIVGEREVKELPLNGRSFDNLITLNPGTINYSAMKSAGTSTSNGNTFSVAGRRTGENLFLMNGIEYTGSSQLGVTPGGTSGQLLGIDAIREFNVLTDSYNAEYGKRAGAQVSVVTQSGTNSLHGSVFEFLRNNVLDARNFFDQNSAPPFRRNQFGGSLGGPIKKDKLFVFGNYEGFRQSLALSNVSVVPDAQARLGNLYNTTTGSYAPAPGLNRAMLQYMQLWPDPNGPLLLASGVPSGTALSYNNPKQSLHEDFGTLRTDYILSNKDTLSGFWTIDDGHSILPQVDPLFGSAETLRYQVASLRETHVFSGGVVNTFNFGFSRAAFNYDGVTFVNFPSSLSFVTGLGPGGITVGGGTTTTGLAAITAAGPNNAAGVWNRRNLFTWSDNVQVIRGRHTFAVGFWMQRIQDNENTGSRQTGVAAFASLNTFLTGTLTTFQAIPSPNELGWRSLFGAWHIEDTIRVRPNLTLQLGLRHEFTNGWNEVSGRAANYITDGNGVLLTAPRIGSSVFTENNATKLFGPRVGIAWDAFGNGKTAVRASFGTYYSLIDDLSFLLNALPPANGALSLTGSLPSIVPIARVPPAPACNQGLPVGCTIFAPQGVQPDAKTPAVQQWSATVEQQLDRATVVRVTYIGSFGVHGLLSVDPNSVPAQICSSATCVTGGTGTARGAVTQGQQYIPVSAFRPNRDLGAGFFWYTAGNSSYQALRTEVTRRLTAGLDFRANYTYSKSLDVNSALTIAQANNQPQLVMDRNDPKRDWGPSALNVANQASISARYELPFGPGKHWNFSGNRAGQAVLGGWQINGIVTALSGFPLTPQVGSNRSGDGNTRNPDRPSVNPAFTGNVIVGQQTQWFNPNAYILPAVGTWGNVGRGILTGPSLSSLDMSFFKTIPVRERINLQIRTEMFNILNHTNLGTPNAIVFSNGVISPTAGLITATATTSRQIQFGAKLIF
jgi:hypothetical protein